MKRRGKLSNFIAKLKTTDCETSSSSKSVPPKTVDEAYVSGLTSDQKTAVLYSGEAPLAIIASAGSGKTQTITRRIAHFLAHGVSGSNILAVTFTRKAAEEMKNRVMLTIEDWKKSSLVTVCNFHQLALRILRDHYRELGFTQQFSVLGPEEQCQVVEECIAAFKRKSAEKDGCTSLSIPKDFITESDGTDDEYIDGVGVGHCRPGESSRQPNVSQREIDYFYSFIKKAKSKRQRASEFVADHTAIYGAYIYELKRRQAIDFSDMVPLASALLRQRPLLLHHFRQQYTHILVDEFQDVSADQFELLRLIGVNSNLTVCGDDDQAIYGWRGGSVKSFDMMQSVFGDHRIVMLCRNFRSTAKILQLSQGLIEKNKYRRVKALTTSNDAGEDIRLLIASNPAEEAKVVSGEIRRRRSAFGCKWSSFAVLSRTRNALKTIWFELKKNGIPVRLLSRRKNNPEKSREVLDVLAFCDLVYQSEQSNDSFCRVCNIPKRNFGKATLSALQEMAQLRQISLLEAACKCRFSSGRLTPRQCEIVGSFAKLVIDCRKKVNGLSPDAAISAVVSHFGYWQYIDETRSGNTSEGDRKANLSSLLDFVSTSKTATLEESLRQYRDPSLREKALLTPDVVSVSTVHQAKGKEWDVVFVARFNDSQFPISRREDMASCLKNPNIEAMPDAKSVLSDHLEEERRLAFVALTRAKKVLWLTLPLANAQGDPEVPSRFLEELPQELVKRANSASLNTPQPPVLEESAQTNVLGNNIDPGNLKSSTPTPTLPTSASRKRPRSKSSTCLGFNTKARMVSRLLPK